MFQTTNQIYIIYNYIVLMFCGFSWANSVSACPTSLIHKGGLYLNMCLSPTWILRGLPTCPLPLAMPPKSDHLGSPKKTHRFRRKTVTALCSKHLRTQPEPAADVASSSDPSAWCPSTICLAMRNRHPDPIHPTSKKTWVSPGCP